ncbi:TlpA family protein disulfide reductase [Frankia sp. CNm7]|uniref:TlpA family protein disulfide reductase n=2 Tax=Frankia nepalensis TaxID=1836974 RepID=A0A937RNR0_9ACTN|nr:TlpA disulfide reductase family protein [Frankia nepalensis]MBL7496035.1 TlpA family protein disulfide reductase [Frankia nepalensis]MBL7511844.1 TlpA family protein disulfide reductase [Frankia nepalensis]MBL7517212.1 TlpA family protein disulfide reductase [Frankia nepalensis]MBL7630639.1 TlpA family protein disulfide reductase [Frankia nepalensis]
MRWTRRRRGSAGAARGVAGPGRRFALPALALAVGLALTGCSGGSDAVDATGGGNFGFVQQAPGQDYAAPGDRKAAPALSGKTLTDEDLDVASLRGKVVVINFWASWCAPCRAETPALVKLAGERPEIAFVGVNSRDDVSPARAFVRTFGVTFPSLFDEVGKLTAHWPISVGLPSTVVLDPEGRIAARFTGGVTEAELAPVLDRVTAET